MSFGARGSELARLSMPIVFSIGALIAGVTEVHRFARNDDPIFQPLTKENP
jgi:hypothetical protein